MNYNIKPSSLEAEEQEVFKLYYFDVVFSICKWTSAHLIKIGLLFELLEYKAVSSGQQPIGEKIIHMEKLLSNKNFTFLKEDEEILIPISKHKDEYLFYLYNKKMEYTGGIIFNSDHKLGLPSYIGTLVLNKSSN